MAEKYHTLDIEKSLGFKFPRGMSRSLGAIKDVSVMDALHKSILKLIEEFGHLDFDALQRSESFKQARVDVFIEYGPQLHPPRFVNRDAWLVDPKNNDWDGRYPTALFYHVPADRSKLEGLFMKLLLAKVAKYHENHKATDNTSDIKTVSSRGERSEEPSNGTNATMHEKKHARLDEEDDELQDQLAIDSKTNTTPFITFSQKPNLRQSRTKFVRYTNDYADGVHATGKASDPEQSNKNLKELQLPRDDSDHIIVRKPIGANSRDNAQETAQDNVTSRQSNPTTSELHSLTPNSVPETGVRNTEPTQMVPPGAADCAPRLAQSSTTNADVPHGSGTALKVLRATVTSSKTTSMVSFDLQNATTTSRSACDSCKRSKTKCDRERPCERCQKQGKECLPNMSNTETLQSTGLNVTPEAVGRSDQREAPKTLPIVQSLLSSGAFAPHEPERVGKDHVQTTAQTTDHLNTANTQEDVESSTTKDSTLSDGLTDTTFNSSDVLCSTELEPAIPSNSKESKQTTEASTQTITTQRCELTMQMPSAEPSQETAGPLSIKEPKQIIEASTQSTASQRSELTIQLPSAEPGLKEFVIVGSDTSVAELLSGVQKRMDWRLDGKEIKYLKLRPVGAGAESGAYLIKKANPDTWKTFLDVETTGGEKLIAVAEVEV